MDEDFVAVSHSLIEQVQAEVRECEARGCRWEGYIADGRCVCSSYGWWIAGGAAALGIGWLLLRGKRR